MKDALGRSVARKAGSELLGMANGVPGFAEHPRGMSGWSDLFIEMFGRNRQYARRSVGLALMIERSGRHTVPQIFAGDRHLGGCDDLYALERAGKLDLLLAS